MRYGISGLPYFWCGIIVLGSVYPVHAEKGGQEHDTRPQEVTADSLSLARRHFSFGHQNFTRKQYGEAEAQFTKSWHLNPKSDQTAYYLGKLCNETERYGEAATWFRKVFELAPEGKYVTNTWYYLSQIYLMNEDRTRAIEAFEALLDLSPKRERELSYLHHLVALYVDEGDYEAALKYARRWGELEPDNPDVQDTVARLALSTGEEDEALKKMEEVIAIDPEDYSTLERLADMYRKRGDKEKAFAAYEKLHAHNPRSFLYLDYLFALGRDLGKPDGSQLEILRKMHKLQPDNLRVIELLADKTSSIGMINKGLRLAPRSGKLNYMKGEYYYKRWKSSSTKRDSVQALKWYGKAEHDPQWRANARRMIDEINPPLTEEEKLRQKFFQKRADEEVGTKGKK